MYYIAHARMPSNKAYGIQMAKMCEAFIESGVELTLVVSSRGTGSLQEAYALSCEVPVRRIPVLDLQFLGAIGYRLTALQFMVGTSFFLLSKMLSNEKFVMYTIDMDNFSFGPLALFPRPLFAEMHSTKTRNVFTRRFFNRAGIIATNTIIGESIAAACAVSPERMLIEPNGVDAAVLSDVRTKEGARDMLGLPDTPYALYVGRFYEWKGLGILSDAASSSSLPIHLVGGTREEYESVTGKSGKSLVFHGLRPSAEMPLWIASADVVLLLGTRTNQDSYRYTSPMKIFEYLAAQRPIVASKTPANTSIIAADAAFWYEPDDTASFATAIREASTSSARELRIAAGRALAERHTWKRRAERILAFMASRYA